MSDSVLQARAAGIATVTLNRPEALNALDQPLAKGLVGALADRLARGPGSAYARTKALLRGSLSENLETQLQREQESFAACSATLDFAEGVAAFVEKREAMFRGE